MWNPPAPFRTSGHAAAQSGDAREVSVARCSLALAVPRSNTVGAMAPENPLHGAVEVGAAELWGSGEFGEQDHGLIIIGAEVNGTRIGRVRIRPVRSALPRYLHAFVEQCVASGSTIRTDDWHGYVGLARRGYLHEVLPYWQNWDPGEGPVAGRSIPRCLAWIGWPCGRRVGWSVRIRAPPASRNWVTIWTSSRSDLTRAGATTQGSSSSASYNKR